MLSTKTKKWATYGKKKNRIVDVRTIREENKENFPARVVTPVQESDDNQEPVKPLEATQKAAVKKATVRRKALKQRNASDDESTEEAYVPLSNTPVKQVVRKTRRKAVEVSVDLEVVEVPSEVSAKGRSRTSSRRTSALPPDQPEATATQPQVIAPVEESIASPIATRRSSRRSSALPIPQEDSASLHASTSALPPLDEFVSPLDDNNSLAMSPAPARRSRRISALPLSNSIDPETTDTVPAKATKRLPKRTSEPLAEPSLPSRQTKRTSTSAPSTQTVRVRPSARPALPKASQEEEIIFTGRSPAKRKSKGSSSSGDVEIVTSRCSTSKSTRRSKGSGVIERIKPSSTPFLPTATGEEADQLIENLFSPDLSIDISPVKASTKARKSPARRKTRKASSLIDPSEFYDPSSKSSAVTKRLVPVARKARRQAIPPAPRESIVVGSSSEDEVEVQEGPSPVKSSQSQQVSTPDRKVSVYVPSPAERIFASTPVPTEAFTPPQETSAEPSVSNVVLPALSKTAFPQLVQPLLSACSQTKPYNFSAFVLPSSTHMLSPSSPSSHQRTTSAQTWRKLGEATYSEIYVVDSIVCKIVPLLHPTKKLAGARPEETKWEDALRELKITKMLGGKGFVELLSAHVIQGVYPVGLLEEWDGFKECQPEKSENVRPSAFTASQLYLILCLPYGGVDLETFRCRDWQQAASILWQVASSLNEAEQTWQFEHRDLHWGNILIERTISPLLPSTQFTPLRRSTQSISSRLGADKSGCRVRIIDFTLSSVTDGERIQGGMEGDELFEGEGDYQFDVYRMMRTVSQGRWEEFWPVTNLLWLHYLVRKLLHEKGLRKPPPPGSPRPLTPTLPRLLGQRRSFGGPLRPKYKKDLDKFSPEERECYTALVRAEEGLAQLVEGALKGEEAWNCTAEFLAWWERVAFIN